MPTGLDFAQSLLVFAGALAAAAGLALAAVETGPDEGLEPARARLGERVRALVDTRWVAAPRCLTAWLAGRLEVLIRAGFETVDMGVAFGGLVFAVLFVIVPAAAMVNALVGGGPFLFWYYASLAAAFAFLNFAGEKRRLGLLNGLLAAFLGLSLMVVIPIYLVHAFTDHAINTVFSHGVVQSLLVAVFWYGAAYGVGVALEVALRWLGLDAERSGAARLARGFLAALPAAFVLTFLALLAGHLAVQEQSPGRSWQLVLVSTGLTALAMPVTLRVMAWGAARGGAALGLAYGAGLAIAAALGFASAVGIRWGAEGALDAGRALEVLLGQAAGGGDVWLGPDFWVAHLPFVPVLAFMAWVAAGLVAKGAVSAMSAAAGPDAVTERPFLAAGVSSGGVAALLWATAAAV